MSNITREEAIKTLKELWRETNDQWYEETYAMAIEALSDGATKKKAELKEDGEWDCPDEGCDECDYHRSVKWCSLAIPNYEEKIDETYKMVHEAFFEGFNAAEERYKFLIEYVEELDKKSVEAENRHYIKIYADDEPSVKAEKLYQICGETQNREVAEWLKEYFPSTDDNWIPVSERLPKQTDEYIVSVHYSRDCVWTDKFGYTPTTDGGWYDPEDTKQNMVDWNKYIAAWMPLPKPYKGGDTE